MNSQDTIEYIKVLQRKVKILEVAVLLQCSRSFEVLPDDNDNTVKLKAKCFEKYAELQPKMVEKMMEELMEELS